MKSFRKYISEISGLRFIYENLELNSSAGRKRLLNCQLLTKEFELKVNIQSLSETYEFVKTKKNKEFVSNICRTLSQINDISASISNIQFNRVSDDIELFEIKKFCINSQRVLDLIKKSGFSLILLHDLSEVIEILDPQNTKIPAFYIYSDYSPELSDLRKQKDNAKTVEQAEELRLKCLEIEDKIRKELSKKIAKYVNKLEYNLNRLADFDILIAKAKIALKLSLTEPKFTQEITFYHGLFNPQIKSILENQNKVFQAIDIEIPTFPTLITGANMSGKSVLLKTVALSQFMFQFGFFVPAQKAEILPVEEILLSIGDNQDELNGLSSFAVEILNINKIISKAKSSTKILALIDEPARTTNPDEGKAIANAIVEILSKLEVSSLICTHYSGINARKKLRVKGLQNISENENINIENINDFMDYSLVSVEDEKAPAEAIRIAEILGADKELIEKARKKINKI
ncbi:MAG: DNA mismatch repair protein MutS [Bacteroidales bacterium]|nr:DNA mismatch repair protein MutS [Bacteroidales bacterium]MCK9499281.1 DNA mismatch repair protein MutS [Bacteroidales bacterium]MDY0315162.1 DNA mismatch repair protein MutS [Bacteroidales bacterium]